MTGVFCDYLLEHILLLHFLMPHPYVAYVEHTMLMAVFSPVPNSVLKYSTQNISFAIMYGVSKHTDANK